MTEPSPKLRKLTSQKDTLKLIECPVCFQVPFPPIFLCVNGHSICKFCKVKLVECPICKGKLSDVRNRTIEDLVLASKHVCPYRKEGCKVERVGGSIENHITTCGYRPIVCPNKGYQDCDINVLHLSEVIDHFMSTHKTKLISGPSRVVDYEVSSERFDREPLPPMSWGVGLIKFDGSHFLTEVFTHEGMICWIVSYIGPENVAKQYRVKIICQPGGKEVEMQWTVPVYSIHNSMLHKASTGNNDSTFTPSCRLQEFKQTLKDKVGTKYNFLTTYLLSKVGDK